MKRPSSLFRLGLAPCLLLLAGLSACQKPATSEDYAVVQERLEAFIQHEMDDKDLVALSIVLVDDQDLVWAEGFGQADPDNQVPATAETLYRVGSVSKLFTDIGIMQLVERGEVDLDAPLTDYLPDFQPTSSFDTPITLRQLMSHRSGLVREPPVGNYFETTEPSLQETVESLNQTTLVYAPEARVKYSNAGIAVVGYVLERLSGQPFAAYLQQAVLEPMGLHQSAFAPTPAIEAGLAKAYMWSHDGRYYEAPTFQLGMAPAGSMYAPITDLGRFMTVLFRGGEGPGGQVITSETLDAMWTPQFTDGQTQGYGLGFGLSEQGGQRRVGHGGAIYGFATQLYALPEARLGVAVATSTDIANTVMDRIATYALDLMLAHREGRALPEPLVTQPIDPALASRLAGTYASAPPPQSVGFGQLGNLLAGTRASQQDRLHLLSRQDGLMLKHGSTQEVLRMLGDTLIVDGRLAYGQRLVPVDDNQIQMNDALYERVEVSKPTAAPEAWRGLIGEYGWDHNILFIYEKQGRLYSLIEWFFEYPLTRVDDTTFTFPDDGLYPGETLAFERSPDGQATQVLLGGSVVFERRQAAFAVDETFRITPVRPVDELREEALQASPPDETGDLRPSDVVDLATLDTTIQFDIRYATTNNFMSAVFYEQPKAFMQRPAAEALERAHQRLKEQGYGLLIHDAYRPWYVTKMFWDATPEDKKIFVANPDNGSRHNRGCAVDLTLYHLNTGAPVTMVAGYDEMSERSYPDYPGGTDVQRWHRALLREAMEAEGFTVYAYEWWHFDYKDWRAYGLQNQTFEELLTP